MSPRFASLAISPRRRPEGLVVTASHGPAVEEGTVNYDAERQNAPCRTRPRRATWQFQKASTTASPRSLTRLGSSSDARVMKSGASAGIGVAVEIAQRAARVHDVSASNDDRVAGRRPARGHAREDHATSPARGSGDLCCAGERRPSVFRRGRCRLPLGGVWGLDHERGSVSAASTPHQCQALRRHHRNGWLTELASAEW